MLIVFIKEEKYRYDIWGDIFRGSSLEKTHRKYPEYSSYSSH